jgi:hypothetical protein
MGKRELNKRIKMPFEDQVEELTSIILSVHNYSSNMPVNLREEIGNIIELENYKTYGVTGLRRELV